MSISTHSSRKNKNVMSLPDNIRNFESEESFDSPPTSNQVETTEMHLLSLLPIIQKELSESGTEFEGEVPVEITHAANTTTTKHDELSAQTSSGDSSTFHAEEANIDLKQDSWPSAAASSPSPLSQRILIPTNSYIFMGKICPQPESIVPCSMLSADNFPGADGSCIPILQDQKPSLEGQLYFNIRSHRSLNNFPCANYEESTNNFVDPSSRTLSEGYLGVGSANGYVGFTEIQPVPSWEEVDTTYEDSLIDELSTGGNENNNGRGSASPHSPGLANLKPRLVEYVGDQFHNKNPHTRRTIILNPRRMSKNDPVVFYRFYQFSCPCLGKVWFSPLHRARHGCFCRDCHHFLKPFGHVDGLTPYMGHELCYAKYECHICGRNWSCQKSRSNFPDNCFTCGTIVYPYYQVSHSILRRKIMWSNRSTLQFRNPVYSESSNVSIVDEDYEYIAPDTSDEFNPSNHQKLCMASSISFDEDGHNDESDNGIRLTQETTDYPEITVTTANSSINLTTTSPNSILKPKAGISISEPLVMSSSNNSSPRWFTNEDNTDSSSSSTSAGPGGLGARNRK